MLIIYFLALLSYATATYNYIEVVQNIEPKSQGCAECVDDPNCINITGSYYCMSNINTEWEYAKVKCPRKGAYLSSFPDRATMLTVIDKLGCNLWVGATVPVTYKLPSIYWSWLSGYGIPENLWVPGAPTGTSFCAYVSCECVNENHTGCKGLRNADCTFKKGFICKYD